MVLIYSQSGQLANRLWQASYFISNAIEYKYSLFHLGFSKYLEYFDENVPFQLKQLDIKCEIIDFKTTGLKNRMIINYANYSKVFNKIFNFHYPNIREITLKTNTSKYDLSQESFITLAKNKILMVDGWRFVDYAALRKHGELIRKIFKPNKCFLANVEIIKKNNHLKFDKIIGVHIRRGDYSRFLNGIWFYSISDYVSFMKQTMLLPCFKKMSLGFLLCSDEEINIAFFNEFNIICSTTHFIEDLYALSTCDLIIGPPSTYSAWAAFYGKVPLLFLNNKKMHIDEKNIENVWETLSY